MDFLQLKERRMYLAKKGNCRKGLTHSFDKVRDDKLKGMILYFFPEFKFSLWRCEKCKKVIEST